MSQSLPRVVLDTVIFVQALISGRGAAAGCIDRLKAGRFILLMSDAVLKEAKEVPLRPGLTNRYPYLTAERVNEFVQEIQALAVHVASPPNVFTLPRDPKDEPLIDLAAAGMAEFLVTWNHRHLTYLMDDDTPEGKEFCQRFPNIKICAPPAFLSAIDALQTGQLS
jgi:putative PIN family toxin of toxin-antitoxin system